MLEPGRYELTPYSLRLKVWMNGKRCEECARNGLTGWPEPDFAEKNVPDDAVIDGCNQRQHGLCGRIGQQVSNQLNNFRPLRIAE